MVCSPLYISGDLKSLGSMSHEGSSPLPSIPYNQRIISYLTDNCCWGKSPFTEILQAGPNFSDHYHIDQKQRKTVVCN